MQVVVKFTSVLIAELLLGIGIGTLIQRKLDEQLLSSVNATTDNGTISQTNGVCDEDPAEADKHAAELKGSVSTRAATATVGCAIANGGSMNSVNVDCGGADAAKKQKAH